LKKNEPIIKIKDVGKSFIQPDGTKLQVLSGINFSIERGKIFSITGVSGSGKSTLLHLMGSFEKPDSGNIFFSGEDINKFNKKRLTEYRNSEIGFIYQFHYLMPELTILENVSFPMLIKDFNRKKAEERAKILLEKVGLRERVLNMPSDLSGGERQRAAIARSLINRPELLLADEPTGNLDRRTGNRVFELFLELIREYNLTAVIATHNESLAERSDFNLHLI